jgi:class 3 adenylate cyclase/DNA-binding response OmpR family regulator
MAGETILVVDDSKAALDFIVDYVLKPNGYQSIVARNGSEGVRKALAEQPDLIILDLEMPKMGGVEVLRVLKEKSLNIPVIISTGHGSEAIAVEVFRLGVRDYITKPYEVADMLAAIEHALTESRVTRERDELVDRLRQAHRSLEARLVELSTLYSISKSVTTLLDREGLLQRIVEAAQFLTGAQSCTLRLKEVQTGQLRIQAAIGPRDDRQRAECDQIAQQAIAVQRSVALPATIAVPLQVGNNLIGTLDINNGAQAREFGEHDMRLLQALADYAAIAIENSRLFYELEQSKEREKQVIRNLFEHFVTPSVVDQLLNNPGLAALGGARRPITVLFADIRGFTSLSEQLQPEMLVKALNHHLAMGAEAVLQQEGTLDKFMGDAVMAFFNAPVAQADYPLRAVKAAVTMQQTVVARSTTMPLQMRLRFGVGIATGDAVVGNIGTEQMMNYTAIGNCVNLARRLQEIAKGGQILIDQATYQAVSLHTIVKPLGSIEVKGFRTPPKVYEVIGLR